MKEVLKQAMEYVNNVEPSIQNLDPKTLKNFDVPTQVIWLEENDDNPCAGIGYNDVIICGCCGGVIPQNEWKDFVRLGKFTNWLPLRDEIIGY